MSAVVIYLAETRSSGLSEECSASGAQDLWSAIMQEARRMIAAEPSLGGLVTGNILIWPSLVLAVSHRLATRMCDGALPASLLGDIFHEGYRKDRGLAKSLQQDLCRLAEVEPNCPSLASVLLFSKGFQALQAQRHAHALWASGRRDVAMLLQNRISTTSQSDLHPSAKVDTGLFFKRAVAG